MPARASTSTKTRYPACRKDSVAYLFASAVVRVRPRQPAVGPTALTLLTDTVIRHLALQERFTLYLDWRRWTQSGLRRSAAIQAEAGMHAVVHAVAGRTGSKGYRVQVDRHNRVSLIVRFVPDDEWHPSPVADPGPPVTVYCDASVVTGQARAGIVADGQPVTVDLSTLVSERSSEAELLAVCLGLLTAAGDHSPLTVYADETEAVRAGALLYEGQLPPWVYRHGSDLVQRIMVAAMTASRLRQVKVVHLPRDEVAAAHEAANAATPHEYMLSPRTWAARQGVRLSWIDAQRGLDRDVPSKPLFQSRAHALRSGPLWS